MKKRIFSLLLILTILFSSIYISSAEEAKQIVVCSDFFDNDFTITQDIINLQKKIGIIRSRSNLLI